MVGVATALQGQTPSIYGARVVVKGKKKERFPGMYCTNKWGERIWSKYIGLTGSKEEGGMMDD